MLHMGNLGRNFLLAILLVAFVVPTASAGLVQVHINKSDDLVTSEDPIFIEQGKDFTIWLVQIEHIPFVANHLFVLNHSKPDLVVTGKPDPLRHKLTP